MVSFARARTRAWLTKIWPLTDQFIKNDTTQLDNSKEPNEKQLEQNKFFLDASRNGGIWFS